MDKRNSRIHAVDFTKGTLVLLMVVYHVLNYLDYGSIPHDYMAFLPSSFIMVTGFLITQVYSTTQGPAFSAAAWRLGSRALKLFALFTCLNIGVRLLWSRDHYGTMLDLPTFFADWANVYLTGEAAGVAFEVLLPISYVLLVSIGILWIQFTVPHLSQVIAIAVFSLCTLMELNEHSINTLNLFSAGLIGMALGSFQLHTVSTHARSFRLQVALIVVYLGVLLLGMDNYPAQIVITIVSVTILYSLGNLLNPARWWSVQIALLARYSLISYIVQILYLQAASHLVAAAPALRFEGAVSVMIVVALLTWLTVVGVDYGRLRIAAIDRVYRALFA